MKVVRKHPNSVKCFVCGLENEKGLKAEFFELENQELAAIFTPHEKHQSYPGRTHGGVISAILDETMGRAINTTDSGTFGVTVTMSLKYKKPLPYEQELIAIGRVTRNSKILFEATGEIYLPDGTVAVTGTAKYMKASIEKISKDFDVHDDWAINNLDTDQ